MKQTLILLLLCVLKTFGQENSPLEFSYNEFLGYVKIYHPLVKNANLELNKAQANLMMARGGFDPN